MDNKTQKKDAPKSRSRDPSSAADLYSECPLESIVELFTLGYAALSLGRPRKQDTRRAIDIYSDCALDSIIVLFRLGQAALSLGCPQNQASLGRVEDPGTSPSHVVSQSEGEQRENLHELSEQNSEFSKRLGAARKDLVELRREVEKSPIEGWWHAPVDQLSLEELKLYKRKYEELSKILTKAIEDRTTDSHVNDSEEPPRIDP
ncbi:agamous-like MADS-box protein AGL62 [Eucalyptus grandis]|uniref:agamous-like MADS-box protein AGL62 n=1 Tax=Eucalyptus grandis TaxID=71139 RepID=UPI00192F0080|nr:agamous-like MADS-box protein AGL62 [Eucalyptus grandis]